MELNLTRPIAFFDLETTGVNVGKDRIVEIAIVKLLPNGDQKTKIKRVNPGVPIPAETSEIHGIYDEDIKDSPTFKELAHELHQFIEGCDLAGYNSIKFDVPLLVEEFLRVGVDFDVKSRKLIDIQNNLKFCFQALNSSILVLHSFIIILISCISELTIYC